MFRRDPKDRRYRERLAGSYLASLVLHLVSAALMIAVVVNASQAGSSENANGGELVTIEHRAPAIARAAASVTQAAPVPNVQRIAPLRHGPVAQPAHQLRPPARPELSKVAPTAPPNPTPLPQVSMEPRVAPTVAAYETKPEAELPAVPTAMPAPIVAVAVKIPPTAAPKAAPTSAPTAKPATPKPAGPSPVPSAAAVSVAKASVAPSASPAPAVASASPAPRRGVPSPSPTLGATTQKEAGNAPSPGPAGRSSPGPRPGSAASAKPGPTRPINVSPTPRPQLARTVPDINARLRAMLPNNPVSPSQKTYRQNISLSGRLEPTPPPEIIALTRFIFEERGTGNEARIKMWVTGIRHVGPATYCDGWLLRYPENPPGGAMPLFGSHVLPTNGGQIGGLPSGTLPPIVEASASTLCSERRLIPFAASPAPSP